MKLLLLLSLLGVTVFCHHDSDETSDSLDYLLSDSSEEEGGQARCPSGWITFKRPRGKWCVKVYTGNIDWHAAQAQCQSRGSTLTGVETNMERMTVANEGRRVARANGLGLSSIWLGGIRKPECPRPGVCDPANTFKWIDGFTTGNAAFHWAWKEPDALKKGSETQNAIHLLVFPNSMTDPTWPNSYHGDIDDQWYNELNGPSNRFYACGKRA